MPFICTSLPEAGSDINGVPFVPHPSGNGKVSVRSVDADLASIFCKVPGFETCPDPGFPSAAEPQARSRGTRRGDTKRSGAQGERERSEQGRWYPL